MAISSHAYFSVYLVKFRVLFYKTRLIFSVYSLISILTRGNYGISDFTHGLKIVVWEGISLQPLVLRKQGFMGY